MVNAYTVFIGLVLQVAFSTLSCPAGTDFLNDLAVRRFGPESTDPALGSHRCKMWKEGRPVGKSKIHLIAGRNVLELEHL